MKRIISASRRTDIPAFHGDWFMNRVREGAAGYVNPFGGQHYTVSLKPEDVLCFVFWSKNYGPFMKHLDELDRMGYRFYFQFTITGLPDLLEKNVVAREKAVETANELAQRFSPDHVQWRFDPIVISSITPKSVIRETFAQIARAISGATRRCHFSFVTHYGKVQRNFERLHREHGIFFHADEKDREKLERKSKEDGAFAYDFGPDAKIAFANELAIIAAGHGISMHTCCCDDLIGDGPPPIYKAHCVDADLLEKLWGENHIGGKPNPSRKDCGCWESRDIGAYDTCPHGCEYCYANANAQLAAANYEQIQNSRELFALLPDSNRESFPQPAAENLSLFLPVE